MASMGEQSIRLAGQLADGIMISNLCTPGFTRRALELIASDERPRVPSGPLTVVQYAPCVARPDRVEARNFAKGVVGKMIQGAFSNKSTPKSRQWHVLGSGLPEEEFIEMAKRLEAGVKGSDVLSDQVLDLFAVAGNADDCLAAYQRYLDVGVSEMVVTFRGSEPVSEMKYLADALRTLR
jgi:5,10-methylenetetrahydromethanopterin reductase